jgi:hypothetical protein
LRRHIRWHLKRCPGAARNVDFLSRWGTRSTDPRPRPNPHPGKIEPRVGYDLYPESVESLCPRQCLLSLSNKSGDVRSASGINIPRKDDFALTIAIVHVNRRRPSFKVISDLAVIKINFHPKSVIHRKSITVDIVMPCEDIVDILRVFVICSRGQFLAASPRLPAAAQFRLSILAMAPQTKIQRSHAAVVRVAS